MDPNFHVFSASFSHVFENFSKITKVTHSPACWIQNMPWKIYVEPVMSDNKKFVSFFVSNTAPIISPWSCRASVRIYKINGMKPKIIRTTRSLVFDSAASTSWGHMHFILWDTLIDPNNGFIIKDSVEFEVTIDAEVPIGWELTENKFTDERAGVIIKEKENIIQKLNNRISELEDQLESEKNSKLGAIQEPSNLSQKSKPSQPPTQVCEDEVNSLQKKIDELKQSNQKLSEKLKLEISNSEKLLEEETSKTKTAISQLNSEQERCKKIVQDREKLETKIASISTELQNCRKASDSKDSVCNNNFQDQIKLLQDENIKLKNSYSSLRATLNTANSKLAELDDVKMKLKNITLEKADIDAKLNSTNSELSNLKTNMLQQNVTCTKKIQELTVTKNELNAQISSLTSELNDSKSKLTDIENRNYEEQIQKLESEKSDLQNRMKNSYQKYTEAKVAKDNAVAQMDSLSKHMNLINKENNQLKSKINSKQSDADKCQQELNSFQKSDSTLHSNINLLTRELDDAKSKLTSLQQNNASEINNLKTENNKLNNDMNSLQKTLDDANIKIKELMDNNHEQEVLKLANEKIDLLTKLNTKIIEFDTANTTLNNLKKQLENFQKLTEENMKLKNKLDLLIRQNKNARELFDNNTIEKRTTQNEDPNYDKNIKNEELSDNNFNGLHDESKYTTKTNENIRDDVEVNNNFERRIEILKNHFETLVAKCEEDKVKQNMTFSNQVNDLRRQLGIESRRRLHLMNIREKCEGELKIIEEAADIECKLKNDVITQLTDCQKLCKEALLLVMKLTAKIKDKGQLPCSLYAHFAVIANFVKEKKILGDEFPTSAGGNQIPVVVSTESLLTKINNLSVQYERRLEILNHAYFSEQSKIQRLQSSMHELKLFADSEAIISRQYKELFRSTSSRLEECRMLLNQTQSLLHLEKEQRNHFEFENRQAADYIKIIENQLNKVQRNVFDGISSITNGSKCSIMGNVSDDFEEDELVPIVKQMSVTSSPTSTSTTPSIVSTSQVTVHSSVTDESSGSSGNSAQDNSTSSVVDSNNQEAEEIYEEPTSGNNRNDSRNVLKNSSESGVLEQKEEKSSSIPNENSGAQQEIDNSQIKATSSDSNSAKLSYPNDSTPQVNSNESVDDDDLTPGNGTNINQK